MQTSCEEKLRPECDLHDECGAQEEKEFMISRHEEEEEYDDDGDEEEFTFMSFGELSLVSADEAFVDGQIKPVFPLFNQELLFDQTSYRFDEEDLPRKPPVKKIFVQTESGGEAHKNTDHDDTSSSSDGQVVSGPYCDISNRKVVEVTSSSDTCKKSNSTGFSKIWRFKDLVSRSNSDGRDAFVFLNEPPSKKPAAVEQVKAGAALDRSTDKVKASKGRRTAPYSAHEVYLRNKAKEGKKRSSYLPYRPELMGFFTSVNGGFSKNVHPY